MKTKPLVFLGIVLLLASAASASPVEKSYTNSAGAEYTVSFDEETEEIRVVVRNPTDTTAPGFFDIDIDDTYSKSRSPMIPPNETRRYSFDLTEGVDVTRENHSVKFNGGEEALWFNYTRDIDSVSPERYAAPEIEAVTLETGTLHGKNRTFINVSANNPTGRSWLVTVRAHTMETTGYYGVVYLPPHGSGYDRVPLNERPGELVAGEVRMYEENFSSRDGAFDQVEVYGRSSGETEWRKENYTTVAAPWEKRPYVYENASAYRDKVSPETAWESPVLWAVGVVVAFVGFVLVVRWRR